MGRISLLAVARQKDPKENKLFIKSYPTRTFCGRRKPEPLKNSPSGEWSRRINNKDRLVYIVSNEDIIVTQCKGHYDDN